MEDATATIVSSIEIFESNFEMNEHHEEESVAEVMESCKEMDERNREEALVVTGSAAVQSTTSALNLASIPINEPDGVASVTGRTRFSDVNIEVGRGAVLRVDEENGMYVWCSVCKKRDGTPLRITTRNAFTSYYWKRHILSDGHKKSSIQ